MAYVTCTVTTGDEDDHVGEHADNEDYDIEDKDEDTNKDANTDVDE